jgi:F0F1-type ATP synthase assembly protein I
VVGISTKGRRIGYVRDWARYSGLGLQLAAPIGAGCLLGHYLDREFASKPWLLVAGAAAGFALGFVGFFVTVYRLEKRRPDGKE